MSGGTASAIDGLLRTDFPSASPNLFLMNPSGVMFGSNAELDVEGSFHAATADYIRLYMAMELSTKQWRLVFGDGSKRRWVAVKAGYREQLREAVAKAKEKFGLPGDIPVVCR